MHKQLTSLSTWKTHVWSAQALASHHVSDVRGCMTVMQQCTAGVWTWNPAAAVPMHSSNPANESRA
jgi:hypothetical protein